MQKLLYFLTCGAIALFTSAAPLDASAQSTWNLGGSSCNPGSGNPNTANCSSGSLTANIWGLGNTGNSGQFALGQLADYDPHGFGVFTGANETTSNGQHAFDNATTGTGCGACGGNQELMLLQFSAAVNLTQMAIGYWGTDADVSILRWDGPADGTPNQVNAGNTLQCETSANYVGSTFTANGTACSTGGTSAASGGWTLVSSMDLLHDASAVTGDNPNGGTANTKVFNTSAGTGYTADNKVSSWWIISTYNGGATGNSNLQNDGLDAFKILSFTANTCSGTFTGNGTNGTCTTSQGQVPEPGSLALSGLALAGIFAGRRRIARAVSTPA